MSSLSDCIFIISYPILSVKNSICKQSISKKQRPPITPSGVVFALSLRLFVSLFGYRKEKGLTQAELGKLLGVSFQAVSKWELDKTMPDSFLLPRLADVFGCSIDDLFDHVPKK